MRFVQFFFLVTLIMTSGLARASNDACPGNPNALGTSRVLAISPSEFKGIGSMQYKQTLPLNDHEVVITFDDGPLPPYSNIILDTLASQCVKATYFLIGRMAHEYPSIVRRIYNAGHSIGTHTENHPLALQRLPLQRVASEVESGVASVDVALGDPKALSPFFRIPGLARNNAIDNYLASKSLVTWSADVVADDWFRHISAKAIVQRPCDGWKQKAEASCFSMTFIQPLLRHCQSCSRSSRLVASVWCRWWQLAIGRNSCPNG